MGNGAGLALVHGRLPDSFSQQPGTMAGAGPRTLRPLRDSSRRQAGSIIDPVDLAGEAFDGAEPEYPASVGYRSGRGRALASGRPPNAALLQALDPMDSDEEQALLPRQKDRACLERPARTGPSVTGAKAHQAQLPHRA